MDSTSIMGCTVGASCMAAHLSSRYLKNMLSQRCKIGEQVRNTSPYSKIVFTHVPKSGGSSVKEYLSRHAPGRLRSGQHEHFLVSATGEPDAILTTILRDPVAKAISFYSYVNDCQKLPASEQDNKLWQSTFHADPVVWSADPTVHSLLQLDPLALFLPSVPNATDLINSLRHEGTRQLQPVPLKDTVSGSFTSYVRYTDTFPAQYQCRQHLEVAFILLKQYEVVGTLEQSAEFYEVLNRRAKIGHTHTNKASAAYAGSSSEPIHLNRSRYQHRMLSSADRAAMEAYLQAPLYCASLLWRIAALISEADAQCPL